MLRKIFSIRDKFKIASDVQNLEKCHRIHCQCVVRLQEAVWSRPGFEAASDARDEYNRCLYLSKKWHQKWPL